MFGSIEEEKKDSEKKQIIVRQASPIVISSKPEADKQYLLKKEDVSDVDIVLDTLYKVWNVCVTVHQTYAPQSQYRWASGEEAETQRQEEAEAQRQEEALETRRKAEETAFHRVPSFACCNKQTSAKIGRYWGYD